MITKYLTFVTVKKSNGEIPANKQSQNVFNKSGEIRVTDYSIYYEL